MLHCFQHELMGHTQNRSRLRGKPHVITSIVPNMVLQFSVINKKRNHLKVDTSRALLLSHTAGCKHPSRPWLELP